MTGHRIVCVETRFPHHHITHVGIGPGPGHAAEHLDVLAVRAALARGERFYTEDAFGSTAEVEPYDIDVGDGAIRTIRSAADATPQNNLDNLRLCR